MRLHRLRLQEQFATFTGMKFLAVMLLLIMPLAAMAATEIDTRSAKYASLVMDADTGEVFYARNADTKRYPASLTKMMTLYMLFDQMKRGKINESTRFHVSPKAASQPQTNIGLKAGQTIRAGDAIKALVVRSANDVAVVVAEALAGSEWNFALNMTTRARQLGMRKTQFRNAHGLPDRQQFTTARDISRLAIALRRDFPQYYHYFKTTQFKWAGKTYKSHNRVMGKFDGADGIKTGYIRMSGFNLATSVKRDGYHMVAVVMGGQSGKIRDNHMLSLLDRSFTKIAGRSSPRVFADAPTPQWRPVPEPVLAKAPTQETEKISATAMAAKQEENSAKPVNTLRLINPKPPQQTPRTPAPQTLNARYKALSNQQELSEDWGIQVGAFDDPAKAMNAVTGAAKIAKPWLGNSKVSIGELSQRKGGIHRARFANLSENQARKACETLVKNQRQCFVYRVKSDGRG